MYEGRGLIKERNKQKRVAMYNLYYLKDIALDAFESRKAELNSNSKNRNWFYLVKLHTLPKLDRLLISEITQTEICNTLTPICYTKAVTAVRALIALILNICLKYAAALGLNVDFTSNKKARALLGKNAIKPR